MYYYCKNDQMNLGKKERSRQYNTRQLKVHNHLKQLFIIEGEKSS